MDRNWTDRCPERSCRHPPHEHDHTPELAGLGERVLYCRGCRRHEVARAPRWRWMARSIAPRAS
jgi:hypothetical protein